MRYTHPNHYTLLLAILVASWTNVSWAETEPEIGMSTRYLTKAHYGGEDGGIQAFDIWNAGGGTLNWTIDANVPWISCTPSSGISHTGDPNTSVTVTYSTSELALGMYNGILTISDPSATNNPQTIEITLGVCEDTYGSGGLTWAHNREMWFDAEDRNIRGPFAITLLDYPPYAFITINIVENPYPDKFSFGFSPSFDERPLCLMPAVTGGTFGTYFSNVGFVPEDDYVAFDVKFETSGWPLAPPYMVTVKYGMSYHIRINGVSSPEDAGPFKGTVLGFPGSETDPHWIWTGMAVGRRVSPGNWTNVEYSNPDLWNAADMVIGDLDQVRRPTGGTIEPLDTHKEAIFTALASGRVAVVDQLSYDMLMSDARLVNANQVEFTYGAATLSCVYFDGGVLVGSGGYYRLGWANTAGAFVVPAPEYRDIARALNRICFSARDPDVDSDGDVDFQDFALLAQHWDAADCNSANDWCQSADSEHDGGVGFTDVSKCAEHWLRERAVPDVTGMPQAEAQAAITGAFLVVGNITEHYHHAIPAGNVIRTEPVAGTKVNTGSPVGLFVSIGHDPTCGMVWVSINDPGVSGHEGFSGYMSKYETTNAQYCQFLNEAKASGDIIVSGNDAIGANGSNGGEDFVGQLYYDGDGQGYPDDGRAPNGGAARIHYVGCVFNVDSGFENHPVTYVNWYGATAFCNFYGYRLPTEWEWQAVADYDGSYTYGCGTTINTSMANYLASRHPDGTTAVGAFGTYGYGICDMAGNLWEWSSWIRSGNCVICGGGWRLYSHFCTVAYRNNPGPDHRDYDIGFRCVLDF